MEGGRGGGNDVELLSKTLQVEHKLFNFDFKENPRGRYLKISEKTSSSRSTIIVPVNGISWFLYLFNYYANSEEQEVFSRELQLDTKIFYFDVGENRRGRFLKVSEASVSRNRSTIIVPAGNASDEGWSAFRNILAEIDEASRLYPVSNQDFQPAFTPNSESVMFDCASQPNHFDRIPNSVVLLILNRIGGDVKDLGRCSLVSKRFQDLVREVPNIVFKVDSVNWISKSSKPRWTFRSIFQCIAEARQALWTRSDVDGVVELQTLTQILSNFTDIRCLKIEFPSWKVWNDDYSMLWRADFGSKLEKIAILCVDSVVYPASSSKGTYGVIRVRDPRIVFNRHVIADRIWKAANDKHYLLHPIVVEHSKLESLVLTDASGKGMLCMNRDQLEEFRLKPLPASSAIEGILNMRVSYADNLKLPDGVVALGIYTDCYPA